MQRRRRVEDDLTLLRSLQRRADDLGVLVEWANAGEDVIADLARGLDELQQEVEAAETKKMLGGEYDRSNAIVTIHPGAGGTESQDWAEMLLAHVPEVVGAARLQARGDRLPARRRSRHQERDVHAQRRLRLRPDVGRSRRAPAGAHLAVRSGGAPPHVVRLGASSGRSCPRTSTSRSTRRTCASTPTARAAPAASTSTSPTPPSASRTCRPASSCRARTSGRSTRTARRR